MTNNKTPKQALKDMALLESLGYTVPIPAKALVQKEDMKERGIKQFWRCPSCGHPYESPLKVSIAFCPKQHKMKLIWNF